MTRLAPAPFVLAVLFAAVGASAAGAQAFPGAGVSSLEAGYGGAGRVASQPFQPSTRDVNGNRLVVNGRIIDGRGQSATAYTNDAAVRSGSSSASAIGNLINVQVSGRNNTVVLNARQVNNGQLNARVNLR